MKTALIVLFVVALLFVVTLAAGGARDGRHAGCERLYKSYCKPSWGDLADGWLAPLAAMELDTMRVRAGEASEIPLDASDAPFRFARARLQQGRAVRIGYRCESRSEDQACPQSIVLCREGTGLPASQADDGDWKDKRRAGVDRILCRDGDEAGRLLIHAQGGTLVLVSLGEEASVTFE